MNIFLLAMDISSSSEDEEILLNCMLATLIDEQIMDDEKQPRSKWDGSYARLHLLCNESVNFKKHTLMTPVIFDKLLSLVGLLIDIEDINAPKYVCI